MSFVLIAGPCSAESREQVMSTAEALMSLKSSLFSSSEFVFRAGLWKPRTHPNEFEGVGEEGLSWLREVRRRYGCRVATEVASSLHVRLCLENDIDCLWIGARTTPNPFAVQDIADAVSGYVAEHPSLTILVKNPLNPDVELWSGAVERFRNAGVKDIRLVHRGFSATASKQSQYRYPPMWALPVEMRLRHGDLPMIGDPSHISGDASLVPTVAQQALDLNFDGLMVETHCSPSCAKSDARQQLTPDQLDAMLQTLVVPQREFNDMRLSVLRQEINDIDEQIWQLVVARMDVARKIGELKRENNAAILQEERFRNILSERLEWGRNHNLSPYTIEQITNALHQEALRQQIEK